MVGKGSGISLDTTLTLYVFRQGINKYSKNMEKQKLEKITKFLSEIEVLKRMDHEGFGLVGVQKTDSVADHTAIAAQIAYVLAKLEGVDATKCAVMVLFHENQKSRIGDHHKVASRYFDTKEAGAAAEKEHYDNLGDSIGNDIFEMQEEMRKRNTKEGIIAKDADWLEQAIQAKIFVETGYQGAKDIINNVEQALETDSAKAILTEIKNNPDFLNSWWQGLKKMTYKKL